MEQENQQKSTSSQQLGMDSEESHSGFASLSPPPFQLHASPLAELNDPVQLSATQDQASVQNTGQQGVIQRQSPEYTYFNDPVYRINANVQGTGKVDPTLNGGNQRNGISENLTLDYEANLPTPYGVLTRVYGPLAHNPTPGVPTHAHRPHRIFASISANGSTLSREGDNDPAEVTAIGNLGNFERFVRSNPNDKYSYDGGHLIAAGILDSHDKNAAYNVAPQESGFNRGHYLNKLEKALREAPAGTEYDLEIRVSYATKFYQVCQQQLVQRGLIAGYDQTKPWKVHIPSRVPRGWSVSARIGNHNNDATAGDLHRFADINWPAEQNGGANGGVFKDDANLNETDINPADENHRVVYHMDTPNTGNPAANLGNATELSLNFIQHVPDDEHFLTDPPLTFTQPFAANNDITADEGNWNPAPVAVDYLAATETVYDDLQTKILDANGNALQGSVANKQNAVRQRLALSAARTDNQNYFQLIESTITDDVERAEFADIEDEDKLTAMNTAGVTGQGVMGRLLRNEIARQAAHDRAQENLNRLDEAVTGLNANYANVAALNLNWAGVQAAYGTQNDATKKDLWKKALYVKTYFEKSIRDIELLEAAARHCQGAIDTEQAIIDERQTYDEERQQIIDDYKVQNPYINTEKALRIPKSDLNNAIYNQLGAKPEKPSEQYEEVVGSAQKLHDNRQAGGARRSGRRRKAIKQ